MKTSFLIPSFLAGAALAVLATSSLQAAVLVNYDFSTNTGVPTSVDADVTASNAAWTGVGGNLFSSGNAYANASGVPGSFSAGAYFSFTITADPGYTLNLENLVFDLGAQDGTDGTATYTVNTNVRSDAEAFDWTTNLTINPGALTTVSVTDTEAPAGATWSTLLTVDLSGVEFDNLTDITFRFYPSDDSSESNKWIRYDNITVNGSVIPEPTAIAFLTLSLMGMVVFRRFPFQGRSSGK